MTIPALELRGIQKQFGRTVILTGVDLAIAAGERHAVIGPNGAGKSTLFNLISGRFAPSRGEILLNGRNIGGKPAYEISRLGLSRSFQITNVFPSLSVFENLRCSLLWASGYRYSFWHRLSRLAELTERTEAILAETQLVARRDTQAGLLTYAEQRALEIGMTIAGGAKVILLDEPTAGMSQYETEYMVEIIRRMTEGRTLIMVEHDMNVVFGLADRISVLTYGRMIATDTPQAIRANAEVQEAYLGTSAEAVSQVSAQS